jgi:uncharacterized phage infection (PIP) family protein YhgE
MTEVVDSIKRVTDIMGEISAASNEQRLGVSQIGEAVTQMDQATQQNAALVEEMAAAASSLKGQAQDLVQVVSVFKLDANHVAARAAPRAHSHKPLAGSMRQMPQAHKPVAKSLERDSSNPRPNEQLIKLAGALGDIRDSLMTVSLALTDLVAEMPSAARDEVVTEVERYLHRMREAHKRDFD